MLASLNHVLFSSFKAIPRAEIRRQNLTFTVLSFSYTLLIAVMLLLMVGIAQTPEAPPEIQGNITIVFWSLVCFASSYAISRLGHHSWGFLLFAFACFVGCALAAVAAPDPTVAPSLLYLCINLALGSFLLSFRHNIVIYAATISFIGYVILKYGNHETDLVTTPLSFIVIAGLLLLIGSYLKDRTFHDLENDRANLLNTERLAALGEMAGGIAHEINNPVAIIFSSAQLLQTKHHRNELSDDFMALHLDRISATCQRIKKIITSMQNISRDATTEDIAPTNLNGLVTEVLTICAERLNDHNISVTTDIAADLEVDCARIQISQVFLNLIQNASDALRDLPGERRIYITASAPNGDSQDKSMAKILIGDSGPGIPARIRNQIFEPFFTTKPVTMGTGLGLSVCRNIVNQNQGTISLDEKNSHTLFVMQLPLSKQDQAVVA